MPAATERLRSLDLFRGATIASMILVNNPGTWEHVYAPLRHAEWHGWTFTDTVFPFFLWIVGVAMTLSTAKRIERGEDRRQLLLHAVRRAAILFAIGFLLGPFPHYDFSKIRIPGVLQRIAICYLVATAIFLYTKMRGQVVALLAVYAVYWYFMLHYPVPGFGAGQLQPVGNFGQYLDNLLIPGHMWSQTKVWDPEGLFTTLPAIGTVLLGIFAGYLLRWKTGASRRVVSLLALGAALVLAGQLLSGAMPINKPIWTVSYSLFMGGLASFCLGLWYWLADAARFEVRWLMPVEWMGRNAILLYMLSGLLADACSMIQVGTVSLRAWLYGDVFGSFLSPINASLAFGLLNVIVLGLVAWGLNARKWYLKF
jgi:predicted acyltransferase